MIQHTSGCYWSTGITVEYREHAGSTPEGPRDGWGASLNFYDDGFCNDDADRRRVSTQGELRTRYFIADGDRVSGLSIAIDTLLADAQRMGIMFGRPEMPAMLYYRGDGEDSDYPPPLGWLQLLAAEAARIGWETYK